MSIERPPVGPAPSGHPFGEDWPKLVESIKLGKCVLVLGPKAAIDPTDPNKPILPVQLAEKLQAEIGTEKSIEISTATRGDKSRVPLDDLAHVATKYVRESIKIKLVEKRTPPLLNELVKEFYEQFRGMTTELHENLAQVPFQICLCTTPDTMLRTALKKWSKDPLDRYYAIRDRPEPLSGEDMRMQFSPQRPLIYHLMGSIEDPNSLMLTEDDLMDLPICLIKKDPPLPDELTYVFEAKRNKPVFLFIGFGFGSHYSRFLLKLLCGIDALPTDGIGSRDRLVKPYFVEDEEEKDSSVMMFDDKTTFFQSSLLDFSRELRAAFPAVVSTSTSPFASGFPLVFLCHCKDDKDKIRWIPNELHKNGIECWYDETNLLPGDVWDSKIEKAIQMEINYFVILASSSMQGKNEACFIKEIRQACKRAEKIKGGGFIIPVVIDGERQDPSELVRSIDPTVNLSRYQIINGCDSPQSDQFRNLVNFIQNDWTKRRSE
jgi:hypothetical protein